jgi:hypothetical protein
VWDLCFQQTVVAFTRGRRYLTATSTVPPSVYDGA